MPLHCPHCGTEVSDDARYCLRCGRERPQPQYVPPVPLEAMETATAAPAAAPPHPVPHTPPPVHHTPPPVSLPAPSPAPAPAPASASRRSPVRVWAVTLTAAVLIGGGATAGVMLLSDEDGAGPSQSRDDKPLVVTSDAPTEEAATPPASDAPASPPATTATPGQEIPDPPEVRETTAPPPAPEAPAGYRRVSDPAGFSLAVPDVWSRQGADRGQITYAGSTGMEHLLIGVVRNAPYASSYDNFLTIERKARANQKDFRRLRLEHNTFQGRPGAIWEYTFTDKQTGETLHAIDQGYIAANGTDYSIYTKARDRDWPYARRTFDTALATWSLD